MPDQSTARNHIASLVVMRLHRHLVILHLMLFHQIFQHLLILQVLILHRLWLHLILIHLLVPHLLMLRLLYRLAPKLDPPTLNLLSPHPKWLTPKQHLPMLLLLPHQSLQ